MTRSPWVESVYSLVAQADERIAMHRRTTEDVYGHESSTRHSSSAEPHAAAGHADRRWQRPALSGN